MDRRITALSHLPDARLRDLADVFQIRFDSAGQPQFKVMFEFGFGGTFTPSSNVAVGAKFGRIWSAWVSRRGLDELAAHPSIQRIEALGRMVLDNETSSAVSSVQTSAGGTPLQFATTGAPAPVDLPFTPAAAGQTVTFKMSKGAEAAEGVPGLDFVSTLKVCADAACTTVLGQASNNDAGGDARVTVTFASTTPVTLRASAVIGAGQTGPFAFALTYIGDAQNGIPVGTKAKGSGKDGTGVIVGVIDTGIDFCHPDFIDPATGKSRILFLWDQSLTPGAGEASPADFPDVGGVEYTNAQINASLASCAGGNPAPVRMRDVDAHGTHVSGTAAGNGQATNDPVHEPAGRYAGAAPKADIIMVKGLGQGIVEQHLEEGLQYVHLRAKAAGRPVVMNNSWGGWLDSQDGTSLQERAVSSVAGRGSIAVFAGGNIGYYRAHATQPATIPDLGVADSFQIRMNTCGGGSGVPCGSRPVSLWMDGHDSYDLKLTANDGTSATFPAATLTPDGTSGTVGGITVTVFADTSPEPQNGSKNYFIDIPKATKATNELWTFSLTRAAGSTGNGKWDAYLGLGNQSTIGAFDPAGTPAAAAHILRNIEQNGFTAWTPGQLHTPGTALGVLQVAAITTNTRWWDATAQADEPFDMAVTFRELGNIAYYSSRGPTRDGRAHPDVGAPGTNVLSSASRFASLDPTEMSRDGAHVSFSGTSMATPNASGAIALMLQADPTNFPRPLVRKTAATDAYTTETAPGVPPQGWAGSGRVDVVAALKALAADRAPTVTAFTATPSHVTAGNTVTFNATATDPDGNGTIAEYLWDIDDDGYTDFFTSTPTLVSPPVIGTGTITATVIVADAAGRTAQLSTTLTVDEPADAGADASSDSGVEGGTIGDGGANDGGVSDGGGANDAGPADGGTNDSGVTDAGSNDSGAGDGGANDAGSNDSGVSDSGASDSGTRDSGTGDAGRTDAGSDSGTGTDASTGDSGAAGDASTTDSGEETDSGDDAGNGGGGDDSGCGCKVAGQPASSTGGGAAPGALFGVIALVWRRRRSRRDAEADRSE